MKLEVGRKCPFVSMSTVADGAIIRAVAPDTGAMFADAPNAAGVERRTPSAETVAVSMLRNIAPRYS
jgi:hypothetical protein